MVAVNGGIWSDTRANAKFVVRDELGPFVELLLVPENVSVDKTSDGVSETIGTMVVQFSSVITLWDVDLGKVTSARDLHVFGGLDPVDTSKCTSWHDASPVVSVCAVSNRDTLRVSDGITSRRSPQAEIVDGVQPECLTLSSGRGSGSTVIDTRLSWLRGRGETGGPVSYVPTLIAVVAITVPDLNLISVGQGATREVQAFSVVGPCQMIVSSPIPLLVHTSAITLPNL